MHGIQRPRSRCFPGLPGEEGEKVGGVVGAIQWEKSQRRRRKAFQNEGLPSSSSSSFPSFLPFLLSSNLFKGEKCNISVNPLLQREGKRKPALFPFLFSRKGLLQRKRLLLCFLLSFSGADASAPRCYLDANFLCSFPFLSSGVRRRRRAEMGLFFFLFLREGRRGGGQKSDV